MSRGYIHSSSKSSDTSPNVFKIVASPKFPMFGSPLHAPALAGSRDIDSARRIAAVSLDTLFSPHKRRGYVVCDGYCCASYATATFRFALLAHVLSQRRSTAAHLRFAAAMFAGGFE
jgi:hypothetical protein